MCGFSGSKSAAIAVQVMDSVLTLVVPFSLLMFMYARIVYSLASISNKKFRGLDHEPVGTMPSDNLLAKVIRMGTRIRLSLNRNSRNGRKSRQVRLDKVKKISLQLSNEEITMNNPQGQLLSLAKFIIRKESLGVKVSRRMSSADVLAETKRTGTSMTRSQSFSCAEANFIIRATSLRRVKTATGGNGQKKTDILKNDDKVEHYNNVYNNNKRIGADHQTITLDEEEASVPADETTSSLLDSVANHGGEKSSDSNSERGTMKKINSLNKLQKRCLKMIISVSLIFAILNLPSHVIRLQSMLRSLFDPEYMTSELEFHLQQLFQTVYYFNCIANFITYSACAKSFRTAFIRLPWHVFSSFSQCFRSLCVKNDRITKQSKKREVEHSRLVEFCISELHLSQIPSFAPDFKYVSPPCLLQLESTKDDNQCDERPDDNS